MDRGELERAVGSLEEKIEEGKQAYMTAVRPVKEAIAEKKLPTLNELMEMQKQANSYFNFAEQAVGRSTLLQADHSGIWVTSFAESCAEVLYTLADHFKCLHSYQDVFGGALAAPAKHAYANLQRMVIKYLPPDDAMELKALFADRNLPTHGFNVSAAKDKIDPGRLHAGLTSIGGVIGMGAITWIALMVPSPSPFQTFVFRAVLAIAISAFGTGVPGFLSVKVRQRVEGNELKVIAGGAIAIFVLLMFVHI